MRSSSGPAELLLDLAAALAAIDARWYVFGAQAALVWGRPRLTSDVDATVQFSGGDTQDLIDALRASFTLRIEGSPEFVRVTRVLPLQHQRTDLPLDIVLAGPGLEETFLDRAVPVSIGGVFIPFISPEDLIVTKLLAGRAKDMDDVRGVIAEQQPGLDLEYIRRTLSAVESALGQSDLLSVFEAEIRT